MQNESKLVWFLKARLHPSAGSADFIEIGNIHIKKDQIIAFIDQSGSDCSLLLSNGNKIVPLKENTEDVRRKTGFHEE